MIEAEYEWPFQSHACMGPACAVVEIKDGHVTCWTGSQKPHFVRDGIAAHARPAGRQGATASGWSGPAPTAATTPTTAPWTPPCSPRRSAARCALQYMREQGTGWDPKGPASIHRARAAIDASGKVVAYEFLSKGFSRIDVQTNGSKPAGHARRPFPRRAAQGQRRLRRAGGILRVRQQAHRLGDDRAAARTRLAAAQRASARSGRTADPLRQRVVHGRGGGGARRRPGRAAAAPRQGRRATSRCSRRRPRSRAGSRGPRRARTRPATRSAAAASPIRSATAPPARSSPRSTSTAARARSGRASSPSRTIAARSSTRTGSSTRIEGNIIQGISRTLWEEVKFDPKNVTSVDWLTYPILDITEAPETIDVRLHQPARAGADRRRRAVDPPGGGGDRQRHLRRHRRAPAPRAVLARPGEGRAVVVVGRIAVSVSAIPSRGGGFTRTR